MLLRPVQGGRNIYKVVEIQNTKRIQIQIEIQIQKEIQNTNANT